MIQEILVWSGATLISILFLARKSIAKVWNQFIEDKVQEKTEQNLSKKNKQEIECIHGKFQKVDERFCKLEKKLDLLSDGTLAIMRIKLFEKLERFNNSDEVSEEEFSQLEILFKQYKESGGNGTIDLLFAKAKIKIKNK